MEVTPGVVDGMEDEVVYIAATQSPDVGHDTAVNWGNCEVVGEVV
jgi:hypothetical protein